MKILSEKFLLCIRLGQKQLYFLVNIYIQQRIDAGTVEFSDTPNFKHLKKRRLLAPVLQCCYSSYCKHPLSLSDGGPGGSAARHCGLTLRSQACDDV